jgi:hypothetical protein
MRALMYVDDTVCPRGGSKGRHVWYHVAGMQLVQWIVPKRAGGFAALYAPVWVESVPAHGAIKRRLRRRSSPMTSRWTAHPIAVACEENAAPLEGRATSAPVALVFTFATSDRGPPVLPMRDDDISFSALFGELVKVTADLCEACSLPLLAIHPDVERRGFELALGNVGTQSAQVVVDALCTLHVALDLCCQARGFLVADARAIVTEKRKDSSAPLDARVGALIAEDA